ncbi:sodium:solute symporter family protein [Candidatus Cardinium hertigii]|uniref:sodium:solute symporter family protein n=1 Tax=Candidatus Cardinium hertigii TaxID=247481 RepID=UPI003D7CEAB0
MYMPILLIGTFLVSLLVVGIYFSSKKTTFREYAVGNKQFATTTLVATILATSFGGGSLICTIQSVYDLGLYYIFVMSLDYFGFWVIGRLALRMGPFMHHLSMAETIGSIYGKYPRVMAALVGICSCIAIVTGQILVISVAVKICLGSMDPCVITILSTCLLIFYSTYGSIRAVTYTDVLQFITFSIIIPLICWCMFVQVGKPISEIVVMLQSQTKFQFSNLFQLNTRLLSMLLLSLACLLSHMQPSIMQRAYMSSGPIQAQKAFSYATPFSWFIISLISLIGVFVFAGTPNLSKAAVWEYVVYHIPPIFKGLFAIGLFAIVMSTADAFLNVCSIMVVHDILKILYKKKEITDAFQLKIAKWTTLVVGLFSMIVSFYFQDLLQLMCLALDCSLPIVTAPFILAVFGFRGTSRTALMGMATGLLTILSWNRWVNHSGTIDGSFLAMLANMVAMLAAHYLLKQPENVGWVKPDYQFKQMQQGHARKQAETIEAIKNGWNNKKVTFAKLIPNDCSLCLIGLYMISMAILDYWFIRPDRIYWAIFQCCIGSFFIFSKTFFSKAIPSWCMGLCWLISLSLYLPLNLLFHWWNGVDPIFSISLSLAHLSVVLCVLPIYLGIGVVATTLLASIYPIFIGSSYPVLCDLFLLFMVGLLIFYIIMYLKISLRSAINQILYLKDQKRIQAHPRNSKHICMTQHWCPLMTVLLIRGMALFCTK